MFVFNADLYVEFYLSFVNLSSVKNVFVVGNCIIKFDKSFLINLFYKTKQETIELTASCLKCLSVILEPSNLVRKAKAP